MIALFRRIGPEDERTVCGRLFPDAHNADGMVLWFREPCHLRFFFIRVLMAKGLRRGVPYAGGTASAGRSIPSLHESGRWVFGVLTDTRLCHDKHKSL